MLAFLTHFMCIAYNAWNLSEIHKIGCARLVKYPGEDAKAHMDIMTRIINLLHLERDGLYPKKSTPVFFFFLIPVPRFPRLPVLILLILGTF